MQACRAIARIEMVIVTVLSRPFRPRRGEDGNGQDGVDSRRRSSTTDVQNWSIIQILVLK